MTVPYENLLKAIHAEAEAERDAAIKERDAAIKERDNYARLYAAELSIGNTIRAEVLHLRAEADKANMEQGQSRLWRALVGPKSTCDSRCSKKEYPGMDGHDGMHWECDGTGPAHRKGA